MLADRLHDAAGAFEPQARQSKPGRDDSDSQFGQKLSGIVFRREVNVRPDQSLWALRRDLAPEN
jgi:hypothetical protein